MRNAGGAEWRRSARRIAVILASALVLPMLSGVALAAGIQNLSGTWTAQDGTKWTFTGEGDTYTAVYHGSGAHAKLVGTVTATFDGSNLVGTDHIVEPNQVEGGVPTVADATVQLGFYTRTSGTPLLKGDIVAPSGSYPTELTCQSGPCAHPPCSFIRRPEDRKETEQEAAVADDLDFLLATRVPDLDCHVKLKSEHGDVPAGLNTDALSNNLDQISRSLEREFPKASVAVRNKVAQAVVVAQVLSAVNADGQAAFPGVRELFDTPAFALVAGVALKPPGNSKAADALETLVRTVALNDAVKSAPTP